MQCEEAHNAVLDVDTDAGADVVVVADADAYANRATKLQSCDKCGKRRALALAHVVFA